jgi:benzylsuccinate CoA-transferase BbsF subunit
MSQYPLNGIRVADFGWVWTGPALGQLLADMGAEVIKIESRRRIDLARRYTPHTQGEEISVDASPTFHALNRNKLGITLDLAKEEARELALRLAGISDVVIENFSPRVMRSWGLAYEDFREAKSDIIMIALSATGQTGPLRDAVTYGFSLAGLAGILSLVGYENEGAMGSMIPYPDPVAAGWGAFAVLAAIRYRNRSGKGQYIDLSQTQCIAAMLGYPIMDYFMNRRDAGRMGNRHHHMAPHNCYRCKGSDKWVSIAVNSEEEWRALCRAMGNPEWSKYPTFKDMRSRKLNEDDLDRHIEAWTSGLDHYDVMFRLQRQGVAATATLGALELEQDPHFRSRGLYERVKYPATGEEEVMPGIHWKLGRSTGGIYRPAPRLGGDNDYVFGQLLHMSKSEISALEEKEVIY